MGKQHAHQQDLAALFVIVLKRGDKVRLVEYLITHSNLPGPRGNLALAQAFAREAAVQAESDRDTVWSLCLSLASISPAHAPTNSPMEFLGFCGATGLGAVAVASPPLADRALTELRRLADDSRWRMREAVAMALQELLRARPQRTLPRLKTWISAEHWLAMRAVAAGIAEPSLLEGNARMAATALLLHRRILQRVRAAKDRTAVDGETVGGPPSVEVLHETVEYSEVAGTNLVAVDEEDRGGYRSQLGDAGTVESASQAEGLRERQRGDPSFERADDLAEIRSIEAG